MRSERNDRAWYGFEGAVSKIIPALRKEGFVVSDVHDSSFNQRYTIFNNQSEQIGELNIDKKFGRFIQKNSHRGVTIYRNHFQSSKLEKFARKYSSPLTIST